MWQRPGDYTFIVRDHLGCVQANGKVANTSPDLHTKLCDVMGTEIVEFRKIDLNLNQPGAWERFVSNTLKRNQEPTVHSFEILRNGEQIGLVKCTDNPKDECSTENALRIYIGNRDIEYVVKSPNLGEFIVRFLYSFCVVVLLNNHDFLKVFRDKSAEGPLCNINIKPYEFSGKMIFHPSAGITKDDQILCTAAMFAYVSILYTLLGMSCGVSCTHYKRVKRQIRSKCQIGRVSCLPERQINIENSSTFSKNLI